MVTLTLIKIDIIDFNCTNGTAIHLREAIVVFAQRMTLNIGILFIQFHELIHTPYLPRLFCE